MTVAECDSQALPVEADPAQFAEHMVIKFDNNSNAQIVKKAKHLKRLAEARGWQYRAEED